jgi:drug/metabolite transporter (DMT)-like permease
MTVLDSRRPVVILGAFICLVVLVATNLVAVRYTNRELPPFWNAGFRFALAACIFGAIAVMRSPARPTRAVVLGSAAYGLLAFAAFFAFVYAGLVHATAALGQTVLALGPLITLLLASGLGMERLRTGAVVGSIVGVLGIAVSFGALDELDVPLTSVLALAVGATAFAAGGIVAKRLPPADPVVQNTIAVAVGAIVLLALSRVAGEAWRMPHAPGTWLAFAYLVVPGTIVVFLLFLFLVRRLPASVVAYQFVLAPVVTIALAALLLDEPAGPGILAGVAIVALGVYLGALRNPARDGPPA